MTPAPADTVPPMNEAPTFDPFAGIEDVPDHTPADNRALLLNNAKRGYVPLRKVFCQQERTAATRAAKLAALVHGKHHRPLDALLLLHALEPILRDEPLDIRTWARLLSVNSPCSPNAASKAFSVLVDLGLVTRTHEGRRARLHPLHELTGEQWTRPGEDDQEGGPGYFTVPHAYWTLGYADRLTLPGKAMLLIILSDTQATKKTSFSMAVSDAYDWYGISERTAERGYRELSRENLTVVKVQKIPDLRHPAGRREIWHRALVAPFSTWDRAQLQKAARTAARGRAPGASDTSTWSPTLRRI